ncbi:hypothetical protein ACFX2H_009270 [Malus domestica]
MTRNSEIRTNETSNIQEFGPRRSTRLNTMISGAASPTQGTTMVAATTATLGEPTTPDKHAISQQQAQTRATRQLAHIQAHGATLPAEA